MTHIVIAQCTDEKRDTNKKLPAREMYAESDLFKAQRRYAEAYGDYWFILSAKYGLIDPKQPINSYDQSLSTGGEQHNYETEIQERLDEFFKGSASDSLVWYGDHETMKLPEGDVHFELICGGEYADRLRTYIEMYNLEYSEPFEGMRIGTRAKKMREEARKAENESIESYA